MPARESLKNKKARAKAVMQALRSHWEEAVCTLDFKTPWQLLVGGILAAQCTDERVNKVTGPMFRDWPEAKDYAQADTAEIENRIKSCGLYRNKAKSIKGSAEMILERYDGEVPDTMEELLTLPGVGRKIANLMLGDAFGIPGIVVDTHCGRITQLLGFTTSKQPPRIEKDLQQILPREDWIDWGHYLVRLGREICQARCRQCVICPLMEYCDYALKHRREIEALSGEDEHACC